MDLSNFTYPMSMADAHWAVRVVANTWVESIELRVATFVMVIMCCCMVWATVLTREIARTAVSVLHTLRASDSAALAELHSRTACICGGASPTHRPHRTNGGPPPGRPPSDVRCHAA